MFGAGNGCTPRSRWAAPCWAALCWAILATTSSPTRAADGDATPRAGRAFQTTIAGTPVDVAPIDRGHLLSWDVGVTTSTSAGDVDVVPLGSLYLFRRDDDQLVRAVVNGVYNDVFLARSLSGSTGADWLLTSSMYASPVAAAPRVDGVARPGEALQHGEFHVGLGLGTRGRAPVAAGEVADVDNMWEANVVVEPAFSWFFRGDETATSFVAPASHRGVLVHGVFRFDGLTRNLMGLNHAGLAFGAHALAGARAGVTPWTRDPQPSSTWQTLSGWLLGVAPVGTLPEQHRLQLSLHAGLGHDLDPFTAFHLGGGPPGEEYFASDTPLVPGAGIEEYAVTHYAVGTLEYRHEAAFFLYWGPLVTLAALDREHDVEGERIRTDDLVGSVGLRATSAFLFSTRIQIHYHVNMDLFRGTPTLGNEFTVHVSGLL